VAYCFKNENKKPLMWGIATWSKRISCSEILKHGTEDDKSYVGEATAQNKTKDGAKKRRQGQETINPRHPYRQKGRRETQRSRNTKDDMEVPTAEDPFLSTFGSVELTPNRHTERRNSKQQSINR
jgi:hypothetical protein